MFLFPARTKKFQSKMKALEWSQHFSHCKSEEFFRHSRAANSAVHGRIKTMVVLVTGKNEDRINTEGARVFTTLYIDFSDAQGQVTQEWWDLAKIRT